MRDSYPHMVARCLRWAAPTSLSAIEWFYGTVVSAVLAAIFGFAQQWLGVEVTFTNPTFQALAYFLLACGTLFVARLAISPLVCWRQDVRSLKKANNAQSDLNDLLRKRNEEIVSNVAQLMMRRNQLIRGGRAKEMGDKLPVIFTLSIFNLGRMPSIAHDYDVQFVYGQTVHHGEVFHPAETLSLKIVSEDQKTELDVCYTAADAIYEKTAVPIPVGGMVNGYLACVFDESIRKIVDEGIFVIKCFDVYGKPVFAETSAGSKQTTPKFFPQMKPTLSRTNRRD